MHLYKTQVHALKRQDISDHELSKCGKQAKPSPARAIRALLPPSLSMTFWRKF